MLEIIIHGRAGQGAKSAGQFLAEAALLKGKYLQTFPNYGPERTGAPMMVFVRVSDKPIKSYAPIVQADVVAVIDETILPIISLDLKKDGILIVNSEKDKKEIKKTTKFNGKVYVIDATGIALKHLGKNFPNTPMLGAIIKITKAVELDALIERIKKNFLNKIGKEKTNQNIEAVKAGFKQVK